MGMAFIVIFCRFNLQDYHGPLNLFSLLFFAELFLVALPFLLSVGAFVIAPQSVQVKRILWMMILLVSFFTYFGYYGAGRDVKGFYLTIAFVTQFILGIFAFAYAQPQKPSTHSEDTRKNRIKDWNWWAGLIVVGPFVLFLLYRVVVVLIEVGVPISKAAITGTYATVCHQVVSSNQNSVAWIGIGFQRNYSMEKSMGNNQR